MLVLVVQVAARQGLYREAAPVVIRVRAVTPRATLTGTDYRGREGTQLWVRGVSVGVDERMHTYHAKKRKARNVQPLHRILCATVFQVVFVHVNRTLSSACRIRHMAM